MCPKLLKQTILSVICACSFADPGVAHATPIVAAAAGEIASFLSGPVGVVITALFLPSIAASHSIAPPADSGISIDFSPRGAAVDASTGPVLGDNGSEAKAIAQAETNFIRRSVAKNGTSAKSGGKAWAFAKGGFKIALPSTAGIAALAPVPDMIDITQRISIKDAFVSQGSEFKLESTNNDDGEIDNNIPGGFAAQIAGKTDPNNPNIQVIPLRPDITWFSVSAKVDDKNNLIVNSTLAGSASMPITESDFVSTTMNGVAGYLLNFQNNYHWLVPNGTNFDTEAGVHSATVDEPSSFLLAVTGLLIVVAISGFTKRDLHPR